MIKKLFLLFGFFGLGLTHPATATERKALVQVNGQIQQVSSNDTLANVRYKQTSATVFYIRTDGSDANCNGKTDAAYSLGVVNCAFATWQKGTDSALVLDTGGQDIYIRAGAEAGTKTWNTSAINVIGPAVGNGSLHFQGNGANTVLNGATDLFYINGPIHVWIGSMKIKSLGGYGTINVGAGANVGLEATGPIFDTAANAHIFVHENLGYFTALNSAYSIVGGSAAHISVNNNGSVAHEGNTVTITGTPALGSFVNVVNSAYLQATGDTFVGAATGYRFYIDTGGVVNTLGNGVNYFPGNAAGIVTNGGLYAQTNQVVFNNAKISGIGTIGGNGHIFYDDGPSAIAFGLANAGSVTDYIAFATSAANKPYIRSSAPYIGLGSGATTYAYADGFGFKVLSGPVQLLKVTYATLPGCAAGTEGSLIAISDSNSAVFNATITASGANHVMAYCDGTNWKVH